MGLKHPILPNAVPHPPVRHRLKELQIPLPHVCKRYSSGQGFVVYPEDKSEHIVLPYSGRNEGFAVEHSDLVEHLRNMAAQTRGIQWLTNVKATQIEKQTVTVNNRLKKTKRQITAELIVDATGRNSVGRKSLGLDSGEIVSRMLGVQLKNTTVPFEGYGHVFLGGPGLVLCYRIGEDAVRFCIDVPLHLSFNNQINALYEQYKEALPRCLRKPFRDALDAERYQWCRIPVKPRIHYGRPGLAFVGDSVGTYHPMCAAGLTLGIDDVMALIDAPDHEEYRRVRKREARVTEMLSVGLYEVFGDDAPESLAMRQAVYRMWRNSDTQRQRTMGYLMGEDTNALRFSHSFLSTVGAAMRNTLSPHTLSVRPGELSLKQRVEQSVQVAGALCHRVGWLVGGMIQGQPPSNSPSKRMKKVA